MGTGIIVTGIITAVIALTSGIYASFTARQKGPIFSNSYIWLSKAEQEKVDKKSEYRLVTVVFGCISGMFLCETIYIFTKFKPALIVGICILVFDMIYAIVRSVKDSKKESK